MKERIAKIRKKILNREVIAYVVAGVLTTAVDYVVFFLINEALKAAGCDVTESASVAQGVSWFSAVLFAFFVNRRYVFQSTEKEPGKVFREMGSFFAARIISGLVVFALMWLLVDKGHMNEYIAKVLTSLFNLVFNYVASKLFIFRKKE